MGHTVGYIILMVLVTSLFVIPYFIKKISAPGMSQTGPPVFPADIKTPDLPFNFGYKAFWYAVKTSHAKEIGEILKLRFLTECNWKYGIEKVYEYPPEKNYVFVSPVIDGWTLLCGWGLPSGDTLEQIDDTKVILKLLSKAFAEAQFFCTHRVTEYHCWMKAKDGEVLRVYSYLGESGENILIEGLPTDIEKTLDLINTFTDNAVNEDDPENDDIILLDESMVMQVAENWSIDPSQLESRNDLSPGLGLLFER